MIIVLSENIPQIPVIKTPVKTYVFVLGAFAIAVSAFIRMTMESMESGGQFQFQTYFIMRQKPQADLLLNENQTATDSDFDFDWEPFNTTNPHKDTFCPLAKCQNSPLCTPCNRRHFLILSTARSGSTTLLRMFNELPNMRLSGENHNQLHYVSELTNNLLNNRPNLLKHPMDKTSGPFMHNAIPQGAMGCIAQDMMHLLNPPPLEVQRDKTINVEDYDKDLILGFKTVRFHLAWTDAREAHQFLNEHFPCTKVLINYQTNLTHQYTSFRKTFAHENDAEYSGPTMKVLAQYNKFQLNLMKHLGDERAKLIEMNDWVNDVGVLNDVVDWLGYENCAFDAIVHENLNGYARDEETIVNLGKDCYYSMYVRSCLRQFLCKIS